MARGTSEKVRKSFRGGIKFPGLHLRNSRRRRRRTVICYDFACAEGEEDGSMLLSLLPRVNKNLDKGGWERTESCRYFHKPGAKTSEKTVRWKGKREWRRGAGWLTGRRNVVFNGKQKSLEKS